MQLQPIEPQSRHVPIRRPGPPVVKERHEANRTEAALAFGRFVVLPGRRQLLAGGVPVALGTRAFDVLMVLLEGRGALITKDDLLNSVWPGTVVEENNLQVQISALRKALGEDRGLILTVPGRGYRFTVGVDPVSAEPFASVTIAPHAAPLTNIPAPVSDLIDREIELDEVLDLVTAHRLVTLTGAGGIGKTRLGAEAARRLLPNFPDGAWVGNLAPLADPELVPATVASALGIQSGGDQMPLAHVGAALRSKRLLLALDGCEHVVEAAAQAAECLLHAVPGLHMLATSQEALGVEGEHVYRLPPLGLPAGDVRGAKEAMRHGAVRLFFARAQAADSQVALDDRAAAAAIAVCRRLDGIPLAIELAAARAATLGIEELATRLDDTLRLLTGGRRTALPRHQTLRATLDWSYGLLTDPERAVLRRLAIFDRGFTLDAASAVAVDEAITESDTVDRIADLYAKSLVSIDVGGTTPRYRLLETTRAYALEKLAECGEFEIIGRRHAECHRDALDCATTIARNRVAGRLCIRIAQSAHGRERQRGIRARHGDLCRWPIARV